MGKGEHVDLDSSDFTFEICEVCHAIFPDLPLSRTFSDMTSAVLSESRRVTSVFKEIQLAFDLLKPFVEEYLAIARLQSLRCSIYELPVEILSEIFTLYVEDVAEASPYTCNGEHPDEDEAILLSQVCSRWRSVLHSTPRLWSKITLGNRCRRAHAHRLILKDLHRAKLHLERSGDTPLCITATFRARKDYYVPLQHLFATLGAHAHRWQSLRLVLNPGDFTRIPFPRALPVVTRITCEAQGITSSLPQFDAPRLRTLNLSGVSLYNDIPQSLMERRKRENVKIDDLVSLTLQGSALEEVSSCLGRASALELLTLGDIWPLSLEEPTLPRFIAPSCKRVLFHVTNDVSRSIEALLKAGEFPKLQTIELASTSRCSTATISLSRIPSFIPMLHRSNYGHLRSFSLTQVIATDTDLLDVLAALPSISELNIDERPPPLFTRSEKKEHPRIFTRYFFYRIYGLGGAGKLLGDRVLLRKLTWLRLVFRNRKLEEKELVSMLKSRFVVESPDSQLVLGADGVPVAGMEDLTFVSLIIPRKRITPWLRRKLATLWD
ncbi:hypothetical protein VKT23_008134 [Stygiomarasmius scandens]|uniref:F-box domain-containing protein n=1 Tax=Marasmiellus scandens TaxID=2682957 RepID=A0ABR1JLN1_9AGAR